MADVAAAALRPPPPEPVLPMLPPTAPPKAPKAKKDLRAEAPPVAEDMGPRIRRLTVLGEQAEKVREEQRAKAAKAAERKAAREKAAHVNANVKAGRKKSAK
jgi:hypothetical protein